MIQFISNFQDVDLSAEPVFEKSGKKGRQPNALTETILNHEGPMVLDFATVAQAAWDAETLGGKREGREIKRVTSVDEACEYVRSKVNAAIQKGEKEGRMLTFLGHKGNVVKGNERVWKAPLKSKPGEYVICLNVRRKKASDIAA